MATYCVGPSATGNGSGSDWSNQKAWSGTFTRGDTWYIRGGTGYADVVFTSAASGTTRNTIKKATASDHVTETGWLTAYGTDQAQCGKVSINASDSDYWTFDGQAGEVTLVNGLANVVTPMGIKFSQTTAGEQTFNFDAGGSNSILRYLELAGPGGTTPYNHTADTACLSSWGSQAEDTLVQHCYIHGGSTNIELSDTRTIVEHCVIVDSLSTNPAAHSNAYYCGFQANDITFRYNIVANYNDEGFFITWYSTASSPPQNIKIYGNIFYSPGNTNPRAIEIRQFDGSGGGQVYDAILVYNNTFAELSGGGFLNRADEGGLGSSTNCACVNNLSYAAGNNLGDTATVATNTADSTDRFTDIGTDFSLTANLQPGTDLGSPYNVDMLGNSRTTWTRGALEFEGTPPGDVVLNVTNLTIGTLTIG